MYLAFYKAEYGTLFDKLIGWWTRPSFIKFWDYKSYSHVEMYFSNGESFSSSARDGGTRFKVIEYDYKWDLYRVPNRDEELIISLCNRQLNKKYDWLCIFFSFLIPIEIHDPDKWICSELCAKLTFNMPKAFKYSPNKLHKYISS